MYGHQYTPEEIAFLRENLSGKSYRALKEMFNAHFNMNLTDNQIKGFAARNKLCNGLSGFFPKGNVPFNAGMKGWQAGGRARATQFKKGHLPMNHRPVGSERISVDGYTEVKVSEPRKWRMKHVLIWEDAHGPLPPKHVVIFADGNRQNVDLDNLVLVSRKQLVQMNKSHLIGGNRELTEAGKLVADIRMAIHSKVKKTGKHADAARSR